MGKRNFAGQVVSYNIKDLSYAQAKEKGGRIFQLWEELKERERLTKRVMKIAMAKKG